MNKAAKEFLHQKFHEWYPSKFVHNCNKSQDPASRSVVKSMGAKWMVDLYNYLKSKPDIIHMKWFIATGLLKL